MYGSGFETLDAPCALSGSTLDSVEVRSDIIFDHFLRFFPFDSQGAVPENPGTVICGVRSSVGPIYCGTAVLK